MKTRGAAIIGCALAIAFGLASRKVHLGIALWDKSLGDVLYAVMVGLIVVAVRPTLRPRNVGSATFAICFAIELFQLTGIAWKLPRVIRFALGTTFAWHDVACYAIGALVVGALRATR